MKQHCKRFKYSLRVPVHFVRIKFSRLEGDVEELESSVATSHRTSIAKWHGDQYYGLHGKFDMYFYGTLAHRTHWNKESVQV